MKKLSIQARTKQWSFNSLGEKESPRLFIIATADSKAFKTCVPFCCQVGDRVGGPQNPDNIGVLFPWVLTSARLHQYLPSEEVAFLSSNTFQKSALKAVGGEQIAPLALTSSLAEPSLHIPVLKIWWIIQQETSSERPCVFRSLSRLLFAACASQIEWEACFHKNNSVDFSKMECLD